MIHQSSMSSQENVQRETQICNSAGKFLESQELEICGFPWLMLYKKIPESSACVFFFFYKSDIWAAAAPPSMPAPPWLPLLRRAALDSSQLLLTMHRQHYSTAPYNNHLRMLCPKCGIFLRMHQPLGIYAAVRIFWISNSQCYVAFVGLVADAGSRRPGPPARRKTPTPPFKIQHVGKLAALICKPIFSSNMW